jgi:hypothetical protein
MTGMSLSFGELDTTMADSKSVSPGSADFGEAMMSVTWIGTEVSTSVGVLFSSSHAPKTIPSATTTTTKRQHRFARSNVFNANLRY